MLALAKAPKDQLKASGLGIRGCRAPRKMTTYVCICFKQKKTTTTTTSYFKLQVHPPTTTTNTCIYHRRALGNPKRGEAVNDTFGAVHLLPSVGAQLAC